MQDIRIMENGPTFSVSCPYLPEFSKRAKELNGQWDRDKRIWTVPARHRARILTVLDELYAYDENETRIAVVELTLGESSISLIRRPVQILGRPIASAKGRGSGAWLGPGVSLIEGAVSSGGSVQNWTTSIAAHSVVEIELPLNAGERLATGDPEPFATARIVSILDPAGDAKRLVAYRDWLEEELARTRTLLENQSSRR